MKRDLDLLVIGAGPAGATLATLAAKQGARVALIDRSEFPRDKVCGEFLSAAGCGVLERLGVLDELLRLGGRWIDSCRLTGRDGRWLDAALPGDGPAGRALGISRYVLDRELVRAAETAGARVLLRHEALNPLFHDGRVSGFELRERGRRDATRSLTASLVVAADGRRSLLARKLHPHLCDPLTSSAGSWFGLKTHLSGVSAQPDRVELHWFDEGYAGLGPIEAGRINLCMMLTVRALKRCGGSPERVLRERVMRNPALQSLLEQARSARWHSVGPLRFAPRRPSAAGAIFIGDAAGTIDPFCGAGMSHALMAAELARPIALRAAAAGVLEDELARDWDATWRRAFLAPTRRVRWQGRLLQRPWLADRLIRGMSWTGPGVRSRLIGLSRSASVVHDG